MNGVMVFPFFMRCSRAYCNARFAILFILVLHADLSSLNFFISVSAELAACVPADISPDGAEELCELVVSVAFSEL